MLKKSILAFAFLSPAIALAAEGIYEPVPLEKKHDHELIKDAGELEEYFERRSLRFKDPELEAYLSEIGNKLIPPETDGYIDYRFYVARHHSPNAFALPDGQIYINTGMLARLQDEAQLASLIAHEINHVAGHHSIISVRASHKKGVASAVLSGMLMGVGGDLAALADLGQSVAFSLSVLGYSRDLEEEADLRGFSKLLDAGYDVRAMPELFLILKEDPEGERRHVNTKWSTHPDLDDRAAYLEKLASDLPESDLETLTRDADDYHARTRSLGFMTVRDYTRADYPRTAIAVARNLLERHPEDARLHAAMGEAYEVLGPRQEDVSESDRREKKKRSNDRRRKTREERMAALLETEAGRENQKRNLASAEQAFLDALAIDEQMPLVHRGLGKVYMSQERYRDAARSYLTYVKLAPGAPDKKHIVEQLKDLKQKIQSGDQPEEGSE